MKTHPRAAELSPHDHRRLTSALFSLSQISNATDYQAATARALEIVATTVEVEYAVVYILDETGAWLLFGGAFPDDSGMAAHFPRLPVDGSFTGAHLREQRARAYTVDKVGGGAAAPLAAIGVRHVAVVPLSLHGTNCGVFHLGRKTDRPFEARELELTHALADLTAVHIENARLYHAARRRVDDTRMVLEVARAVTASLELGPLLEASAQVLAKLIDATNAFVLMLDDDGQALRGVATNNPEWQEATRQIVIPAGAKSLAWRAVLSRAPAAVIDAERAAEVHRGLVELFKEKSLLAVPMLINGEPIGVVVVDDTRATRAWSAPEIERVELVVHQIASAVANARLYAQVRRGYEELARTQSELVKRERLAALGQLAATLAHEVRNPLGVLFNVIGSLGKILPENENVRMLLRIMSEESHRLERLVRELLDFVRPLAPTFDSEALGAIADGAIDGALAELGPAASRMINEIPGTFPKVRLDARMMRRALINLLVNGSQAAGPSGSVTVRAHSITRQGRAFVRLDVSDDGPGIPADVAPRIFEPFFTTRATGTGLGLAVVKGIIEAHGGELTASSGGPGATISADFPLDKSRA